MTNTEGVITTQPRLRAVDYLDDSESSIFDPVIAELEKLVASVPAYRALGEQGQLAANRGAARAARLIATHQSLIAGVVAEQSTHDLGGEGLVQRQGFRTVEEWAKNTTGAPGLTAVNSVRTGVLLTEIEDAGTVDAATGEVQTPTQPWLAPVASALTDGIISVAAAGAITRGLGTPNSSATAELLELAAVELCIEASRGQDPDSLFKSARSKRDEIDIEGVSLRASERYKARSFKVWVRVDGMVEARWVLPPDEGVLIKEAHDRLVSPKLGQIRFVNEEQKAQAEAIKTDDRTPEQLASDGMLHLVMAGADADSSHMLGTGAPVVRITTMIEVKPVVSAEGAGQPAVALGAPESERGRSAAGGPGPVPVLVPVPVPVPTRPRAFPPAAPTTAARVPTASVPSISMPTAPVPAAPAPASPRPVGRVDGANDPISAETVDALRCAGVTKIMVFDQNGHIIETESEQRLFSKRQKDAMAAKFGGCMDPYCDRPPSWTEAHHIEWVVRDNGKTEMRFGIILCKYHHLLYHNEGYEIKIDSFGKYWLIPPIARDPQQKPIEMPLKSANVRDLQLALAAR